MRDIPTNETLQVWKLIEIMVQLAILPVFMTAVVVLVEKQAKRLNEPTVRVRNIDKLDSALDRLRLYRSLFGLILMTQLFKICDSLMQLASVCYGSSLEMDNLIGHAAYFVEPKGFQGPVGLQKMLFNLNFLSMKSGAKFIDLRLTKNRYNLQELFEQEFMYNVKLKSALSVLTGRLSMLDAYVTPVLVLTRLTITRTFFKSFFRKAQK